jgi:hypothetical protein
MNIRSVFAWISSLPKCTVFISLLFLKEYGQAQPPKTQESELKISAVFSVSDSHLGKRYNHIS